MREYIHIILILVLGVLITQILEWLSKRTPVYHTLTLYKEGAAERISICHSTWYDKSRKVVVETTSKVGSDTLVKNWTEHPQMTKASAKVLIDSIETNLRDDGFRETIPSDYIFIYAEVIFDKNLLSNSQEELGYFCESLEDCLADTSNGSVKAFDVFDGRVTYTLKVLDEHKAKLTLIEDLKDAKNIGAQLSKFEIVTD